MKASTSSSYSRRTAGKSSAVNLKVK
jgi:hypothetical protein